MNLPDLPELPEPDLLIQQQEPNQWEPVYARPYHTPEQLRAFAIQYGRLVREECAKACEELNAWDMDDPGASAAAAIRSEE